MQYLADIEEHLGETISTIEQDMKVPVNEFDGKVTYGAKRSNRGKGRCYLEDVIFLRFVHLSTFIQFSDEDLTIVYTDLYPI